MKTLHERIEDKGYIVRVEEKKVEIIEPYTSDVNKYNTKEVVLSSLISGKPLTVSQIEGTFRSFLHHISR